MEYAIDPAGKIILEWGNHHLPEWKQTQKECE